jgi:hypothetical protein
MRVIRLAVGILCVAVSAAGADCLEKSYSIRSVDIPEDSQAIAQFKLRSPNGAVLLTARRADTDDNWNILLTFTRGAKRFSRRVAGARDAEVLWSPDSRWLAVNRLFCCAGFAPSLELFEITAQTVRRVNIAPALLRGFGSGLQCSNGKLSGWALTGVIKWLDNGHLLAAVQVPYPPVCDSPSVFEAREIDVRSRTVINIYDQLAAKKLFWNDLGCDLREATDEYLKNPQSGRIVVEKQSSENVPPR